MKLLRITILFFLLCKSLFSFENNPKEFAEVFSLLLSQTKNYHEKIRVGIKGKNLRRVKRLQHEIEKIGFVMNRARPVELEVHQFSSQKKGDFDVIVYFPNESLVEESSALSIVMSKKQVINGAALAIVFVNNRPNLFVNKMSLKTLSYQFEEAFLDVVKDVGGKS